MNANLTPVGKCLEHCTNADNTVTAVIVVSTNSGDHADWDYIRTVTLAADTTYTRIDAENVLEVHYERKVDARCTDPHSAYAYALVAATAAAFDASVKRNVAFYLRTARDRAPNFLTS